MGIQLKLEVQRVILCILLDKRKIKVLNKYKRRNKCYILQPQKQNMVASK